MGTTLRAFADEMSFILPRVHKEFLRSQSHAIAAAEVSFAQMTILHFLMENRSCKMSELAKVFSVSTSAITGIVDRMAKSGLIRRVRSTADRRVVNIRLTGKGKNLIRHLSVQRRKMIIAIFRHFTPKERELYLIFVRKIYTTLTNLRGRYGTPA